jgi:hypothetical protein
MPSLAGGRVSESSRSHLHYLLAVARDSSEKFLFLSAQQQQLVLQSSQRLLVLIASTVYALDAGPPVQRSTGISAITRSIPLANLESGTTRS